MNAVQTQPPLGLMFGRHVVGMAVVALANPLIYLGGGFYQWSVSFCAALFGAAVIYGLLALFFTKRAKANWPRSFFVLAWILLAVGLIDPWLQAKRLINGVEQHAPVTTNSKAQNFIYEEAATKSAPPPAPTVSPQPEQLQNSAEEEHYRRIFAAHPDANQVAQSSDFNDWLNRYPQYKRVLVDGTTEEIIGMFSHFKLQKKLQQQSASEPPVRYFTDEEVGFPAQPQRRTLSDEEFGL